MIWGKKATKKKKTTKPTTTTSPAVQKKAMYSKSDLMTFLPVEDGTRLDWTVSSVLL